MPDLLQFVLNYGYVVIFGITFAEQIGLPLPALPLLIGMGALSRSGDSSFALVVATATIASLAADFIWYRLGRLHGRSVVRLICRISLEPALLPAKFIPGFNAATVPLAGMMKTPPLRFLAFDIAGVTLWSGTYTSVGYVFSHEVKQIIMYLSTLGTSLVILIALALTVYVAYKLDQRRRFLKALSIKRITPEELKAKIDANQNLLIVDTRNRLDRNTDPVRIPGAFHILPEHLEFQRQDIDFNCEIVIYCTCPNEATSARVAVKLQRMGLTRVRPLQGGLEMWRERNLPLERLD
jgi:membrane protein DedA with SNARE-associated domain/rhodanese-related sulfurtransferase